MKRSLIFVLCLIASPAAAQIQKIQVTAPQTHFTTQSCISTVAAALRTATIDVGYYGPNSSWPACCPTWTRCRSPSRSKKRIPPKS